MPPDPVVEATTLATEPAPVAVDPAAAAASSLFQSSETKPATEVKTEAFVETPEQKAAAEKVAADAKIKADAETKTAADAEAARRAALTEDQRKAEDAATQKVKDDAAKAKIVPEKYEFKAPEGVANDPAVIAEFSSIAKECALTQDQAQKLYDLHVKSAQAHNAKQAGEIAATQASWKEASTNDPEFGGEKLAENLAIAKSALDLNPAIKVLLNESKLGDHPEVIRWMFRAGKLVQQDNFVRGGDRGAAPKDAAKALYPNNT